MSNLYLMKKDELYGYINRDGEIIIEPMYKDAREFSEGLAYVETINNEQGYINCHNKMIIKMNADYLGPFCYGIAQVTINRISGFIDKTGNYVIKPKFQIINRFNEAGMATVKVDRKVGIINIKGDFIVEPIYDSASTFSEGMATVDKNDRTAYVNDKGKIVIDFQFYDASKFSEGLAVASIDGYEYGVIDKTGNFVIQPRFKQLMNFKEGLSAFRDSKNTEKFGYIDTSGNVVIKSKYYQAHDFSEGLAAIYTNKGMGYIDKKGKLVIKDVFTTADDFKDGIACVTYKGNWGYITKDKKWIYKPEGFDLW